MRLSERGISLIAVSEGLRLKSYHLKGETYWTIGYGHNGPDVKKGMTITVLRAKELLLNDVGQATDAINRLVKVPLNQNRFDALVSFVFNVGTGAFEQSTLLKLLNGGHYFLAGLQLLRWTHDSTGGVSPGLVTRRKLERKLWRTKA